MIFLLSAKTWIKDCKKLVEDRNYLLVDAVDSTEEADMTKFSNCIAIEYFCIPPKLLSTMAQKIDDDYIDIDRVEILEKNFFRGKQFATGVLATMRTYLDSDGEINIFIVMRNRGYKYYRNRFKSEFCRVFPDAAPLVFLYDGDKEKAKKGFKRELSNSEKEFLKKELSKKEKELEKMHKSKKKNKKKDKKRKKGWGMLDKTCSYDDI